MVMMISSSNITSSVFELLFVDIPLYSFIYVFISLSMDILCLCDSLSASFCFLINLSFIHHRRWNDVFFSSTFFVPIVFFSFVVRSFCFYRCLNSDVGRDNRNVLSSSKTKQFLLLIFLYATQNIDSSLLMSFRDMMIKQPRFEVLLSFIDKKNKYIF